MPSIGDRSEGNERGPRNGVIVTDVMALLEAAELPRDDPQVAAAHTVLLARLPLTRMVELAGHTREGAAPLRLEGRGGALALEQRDGLTSWVRPPTPEQQRQGQSGRVALLAGLREAGVAPLAMRQVIATALFKARREARLSPSDAERALPVSSGSARPLAAEVGAGVPPVPASPSDRRARPHRTPSRPHQAARHPLRCAFTPRATCTRGAGGTRRREGGGVASRRSWACRCLLRVGV